MFTCSVVSHVIECCLMYMYLVDMTCMHNVIHYNVPVTISKTPQNIKMTFFLKQKNRRRAAIQINMSSAERPTKKAVALKESLIIVLKSVNDPSHT